MPGPTLYDTAQLQQIQRHKLAQQIADRHARRFSAGSNTCETRQCQCIEIARLVHNNFTKGT